VAAARPRASVLGSDIGVSFHRELGHGLDRISARSFTPVFALKIRVAPERELERIVHVIPGNSFFSDH